MTLVAMAMNSVSIYRLQYSCNVCHHMGLWEQGVGGMPKIRSQPRCLNSAILVCVVLSADLMLKYIILFHFLVSNYVTHTYLPHRL